MATYYARKAGNINATDVWATTPSGVAGPVTFVSGDVLVANSFAITVNVSTNLGGLGEVRNDTTGGATAGGSFTLSNAVTLTANAIAGTAQCVTYSGTAGNSATIVGNCTGGSSVAAYGASNNSTGTLTITGNCTGGSSTSANGANNNSTGTLTITGNCTGGSNTSANGANNNSTGTMTITGNCTGGSNATAYGANNNSTGTMTITGTINASEFASGVGGSNRGQITLLSGPFISSTTFGVNPIGCLSWRWASSLNNNTYIQVPTSNLLATRNLVTPDNATNFPAESDVRSAITFGIGGALTGTLVVPAAASVAFGVPVDATTGTATLTAADVRAAIGLATANLDTQLADLPTASENADAVWDEVLTGATHNVNRSAGKRLRQIANERIIADGQTVSANTNTITLEPIGTLCVGQTIVVTDQDTDEKQARFILAFDTGTDTATVDSNWCVVPTAGDEYLLTTVRDPLVTRGDHPSGTVGAEIDEMYLIHGLKSGSALTVTPSSRAAGAISQSITGDGTTTTTVTRT